MTENSLPQSRNLYELTEQEVFAFANDIVEEMIKLLPRHRLAGSGGAGDLYRMIWDGVQEQYEASKAQAVACNLLEVP